jgi:hypothetical protein
MILIFIEGVEEVEEDVVVVEVVGGFVGEEEGDEGFGGDIVVDMGVGAGMVVVVVVIITIIKFKTCGFDPMVFGLGTRTFFWV